MPHIRIELDKISVLKRCESVHHRMNQSRIEDSNNFKILQVKTEIYSLGNIKFIFLLCLRYKFINVYPFVYMSYFGFPIFTDIK